MGKIKVLKREEKRFNARKKEALNKKRDKGNGKKVELSDVINKINKKKKSYNFKCGHKDCSKRYSTLSKCFENHSIKYHDGKLKAVRIKSFKMRY